jgi:hypothetical protein
MPARAMVPVDVFPCIRRFRGHGPLLQGPWAPPAQAFLGGGFVGAAHGRESDGSG